MKLHRIDLEVIKDALAFYSKKGLSSYPAGKQRERYERAMDLKKDIEAHLQNPANRSDNDWCLK